MGWSPFLIPVITVFLFTGAAAEAPQATADLTYVCCDRNELMIDVEASRSTPFLVNLCRAHLWLTALVQRAPREREVPFGGQTTCTHPIPARVEGQEARFSINLRDPLHEAGPLKLELRTDPGFALEPDGAPLSVSSHRYADTVFFYNPSIRPKAAAHPFVDADSAELMKRYGHHPLWSYGDRLFTCYDYDGSPAGTVTIIDHAPIVLTEVVRIPRIEKSLPLGTYGVIGCVGACGPRGFLYVARDPLRLTFALSDGTFQRSLRGSATTPEVAGWANHHCRYAQTYIADPWDFERLFTKVDPRQHRPGWDPALQRQMLNYQAAPGMTHEVVAFALGFPSTFGTAQELLRQTYWRWYPGREDTTAIFYGASLLRIYPSDHFWFTGTIAEQF